MKFIIFITVLIPGIVSANTKLQYANIYADQLIKVFDRALDNPLVSRKLTTNPTYTKILAARSYIEKHGIPTKLGTTSTVQIIDTKLYAQVVSEINTHGRSIFHTQENIKLEENMAGVIFPSITKSGNVTGNTFPVNVWSLTFDDGPSSTRTLKIVDNLNYHTMRASFFMLMRQANKFPASVEYVLANQMELALHSYNHLNLAKESDEVIDYEIGTALKELEIIGNRKVTIFRLPYGAGMRKAELRSKIAKNNLVHIFWNVDTLDWKDRDPVSIFNRVKKQMANTPNKSGVILFHDIHAQTVIASEMVMKHLNDNAKTVCTVGEVINYINNQVQDCL